MSDVFLGIIAFSVLVMAIIQVALIVFAARAARRVGDAVARLERDVRPIVANLQAVSADAVRASAAAAAQVERAQQTVEIVLDRVETGTAHVEQTLQALRDGIMAPAREGFAFLQALRAFFSPGGTHPLRSRPRPRPSAGDDDDALFIG